MALLVVASTLVFPATTQAADEGSILVTLQPNRPDANYVTATRQGNMTPKVITLSRSGDKWTTGPIPGTGCGFFDRPNQTFTITVTAITDRSSTVLGTKDNILVECTKTVNVTVNTPAADSASVQGTVRFVNYLDRSYKASDCADINSATCQKYILNAPGNITITVTGENGNTFTKSYTTNNTNNGHYIITGVPTGTYTVKAQGAYQNPSDSLDVIPILVNKTGVVVSGNTTVDLLQGSSGAGITPTPTPPADSTPAPKCDAAGFTWIICGAISLALGGIDWIRDTIIVPFLDEPPLDKNSDSGQPLYKIWTAFRNIASIFFILVFFLMIFGTAIGFDNYTVKKVLPRLIAGAILVPFSWYICAFIIDIGNILGHGLLALTSSIIPNAAVNFRSNLSAIFLGTSLILIGAAAVGAIATVSLGIFCTILIALLGVFLTLVFRKILISILVILSPLAFLAWILPNTDKWYKYWWTNLIRLVMMYPLIMLLFEAGRLFSYTSASLTGSTSSSVTPFFQIVALFAPTFLIPWTFKWTGGLLALGAAQVGRFTNGLDKRFGKDSDWSKDRAADREVKNLLRAKAQPNNRFGRIKAAALNARAGHGSGFSMLGAAMGTSGRGGMTAQLRRSEAYGAAQSKLGRFQAEHQSSSIASHKESVDQRTEAERLAALRDITAKKAERAGLRQAAHELEDDPNPARSRRDVGSRLADTQFRATQEAARRRVGEEYGKQQGVLLAAQAQAQDAREVARAAMEQEGKVQAELRGKVTSTDRTAAELTNRTIEKATDGGRFITDRTARIERLQATAAAADARTKDDIIAQENAIQGRVRSEGDIQREAVQAALERAQQEKQRTSNNPQAQLSPEETVAVARQARANLSRSRTATMTNAGTMVERIKANEAAGRPEGTLIGIDSQIQKLQEDNPNMTRQQAIRRLATQPGTAARIHAAEDFTQSVGAARGTVEGHHTAIQDEIADAYTTGRGYLTEHDAERNILSNLEGKAQRESFNKITDTLNQARGIATGRQKAAQAIVEDYAKQGKTITLGQAGDIIDRNASVAAAEEGENLVLQGVSKVTGTARGLATGIEKEADRLEPEIRRTHPNLDAASVRLQAERQARQSIATNKVRRGINDTKLATATGIGEDRGIVETADAAIDREMNNTLGEDTLFEPNEDVYLEDGTVLKAKDFAGNRVQLPKGTTLLANQRLRTPITPISRTEAESRIAQKAVQSGIETGIRTQAAKQGSVAALNVASNAATERARREGTNMVDQRLTAYTQAELDKLAGETNQVQAQAKIVGTSMQRGFQQSVTEGTLAAVDRLVDTRVREAGEREVELLDANGAPQIDPATGRPAMARINSITNDKPGNRTLMEIARRAREDKDEATLYAAIRRLGNSDSGRDKLADLRLELFGGATMDNDGVEDFGVKAPTGELLRQYERALEGIKTDGSKDLIKGDASAFSPDNLSADELLKWDNSAVERLAEYTDRLRESAKRAYAAGRAGKARDLLKTREQVLEQMKKVRDEIQDNDSLRGRMNPAKRAAMDAVIEGPNRHNWLGGPDSKGSDRVTARYADLDPITIPAGTPAP